MKQRIPLWRACVYLVCITSLVGGVGWYGKHKFLEYRYTAWHDPAYTIVALLLEGTQGDRLRPEHVAELLGLSVDIPQNLHRFDARRAETRLLELGFVQQVRIEKILPGTLHVAYQLRRPVVYSGDMSNTAMDHEGVLFPCHPFIRPKKLPKLTLGIESGSWGETVVDQDLFRAGLTLLDTFRWIELEGFGEMISIDLSRANHPLLGRREQVLVVRSKESRNGVVYIRFGECLTGKESAQLRAIWKQLPETLEGGVIDCRLPALAFVAAAQG